MNEEENFVATKSITVYSATAEPELNNFFSDTDYTVGTSESLKSLWRDLYR